MDYAVLSGWVCSVFANYKCYNYSDYKITNIISRGDSLFKVAVELISPKREIALLVEKDTIKNENSYSVIDSWNFLDFEYSEKDYEFAKKTGCLRMISHWVLSDRPLSIY